MAEPKFEEFLKEREQNQKQMQMENLMKEFEERKRREKVKEQKQMAFDDTPRFELKSLDALVNEFEADNGRKPTSIDDLKRYFYNKYGEDFLSKMGPIIPSDEDPINPFAPKPQGPDLPSSRMMASKGGIDMDKVKEDASNILNFLGDISPIGQAKKVAKILQDNRSEIKKALREFLKINPTTSGPAKAVEFIVDRYKLPESVAKRLVANELTDANIPTNPFGSADEGFPSRPEFESSAEDTSVPPKKEIDLEELLKRLPEVRNLPDPGFPDYDGKRFPGGPPIDPRPLPEGRPFRPGIDGSDFERRPFRPGIDVSDFEFLNKGGRVMKQTGGITESRTLPPEFIEAAQKTFLADLTRQAGIPSITTATAQQPGETPEQFAQRQAQAQQFGITRAGMAELAPQVAAQDPLQAAAYTQATDPTRGLGAFEPFLTKATTAADAASALTGTGAGTGTGSIASYTSPFQQQVIDTTLAEFDRQRQIQENRLAASALGTAGAFGGGREGVQRAEFQAASNLDRSRLLADLQQRGFQNAAARRQQDLANQQAIANQQRGLGAAAQDFSRAQISGLGTLGAAQQAQTQAVLDAQRQAAQLAVDDPRRRLSMLGAGIAQLTPGAGAVNISEAAAEAPGASPLMKALGLGLAGADIYGRIFK